MEEKPARGRGFDPESMEVGAFLECKHPDEGANNEDDESVD